MDVFTHLLVPYAGALLALGIHRADAPDGRFAVALVFGIAAASPDLDGLLDWTSEAFEGLWWMQHRGFSHTLVGAPLFGLLAAGLLALAARRSPSRFGRVRWRPAFVPAAILGAWMHLALDGITYGGVPLLWPFAFGRVGFPLFDWLVPWLFPVSGILLGVHAWGRLTRRGAARAGAVVLAVILVLGAARLALRPTDLEPGALVFPRPREWEWTVAVPHPNGTWEVAVVVRGERSGVAWFEPMEPREAEEAVERARGTGAYRGFLMGRFGPEVVVATPLEAGGWNVTFIDVAQRHQATHGPRWTPTEPFEAWGFVSIDVRGNATRAVHLGW